MKRTALIFSIILFLLHCLGCAYTRQEPAIIEEPTTPRIVIKEAPVASEGGEKTQKEELFTSTSRYPDLTQGYIENKAFPYVPKVWLLQRGQKIILSGPAQGPPQFNTGVIKEFNYHLVVILSILRGGSIYLTTGDGKSSKEWKSLK